MTDRVLFGVLLMLGFTVTAPLLDVMAKLAASAIPVGQVTAARFIGQALLMAPVCMILRLTLSLPRALFAPVAFRALLLVVSTYCFIAAIRVMPLADALAIAFILPFFLLFMGKFFNGEEIGPRRLTAAITGFAGVLMVIQPSFAAFGAVALFPLGTALGFAGYMVVTRRLSRHLHPVAMQYQTGLFGGLFCLPVLILAEGTGWPALDPVMPEGLFWLWLAGVGFFAALSHLLITFALRFAPAATLAPLNYLEIVSAVFWGFAVFGDFPNRLAFAGITVILASGLYVVWRERINEATTGASA